MYVLGNKGFSLFNLELAFLKTAFSEQSIKVIKNAFVTYVSTFKIHSIIINLSIIFPL